MLKNLILMCTSSFSVISFLRPSLWLSATIGKRIGIRSNILFRRLCVYLCVMFPFFSLPLYFSLLLLFVGSHFFFLSSLVSLCWQCVSVQLFTWVFFSVCCRCWCSPCVCRKNQWEKSLHTYVNRFNIKKLNKSVSCALTHTTYTHTHTFDTFIFLSRLCDNFNIFILFVWCATKWCSVSYTRTQIYACTHSKKEFREKYGVRWIHFLAVEKGARLVHNRTLHDIINLSAATMTKTRAAKQDRRIQWCFSQWVLVAVSFFLLRSGCWALYVYFAEINMRKFQNNEQSNEVTVKKSRVGKQCGGSIPFYLLFLLFSDRTWKNGRHKHIRKYANDSGLSLLILTIFSMAKYPFLRYG